MPNARLHLEASGLVQGVGYRYDARREARRLGLSGWVRNVSDGSVEVKAEGDKSLLERLIEWCHKGPPGAEVDRVDVRWKEYQGDLGAFDIRY